MRNHDCLVFSGVHSISVSMLITVKHLVVGCASRVLTTARVALLCLLVRRLLIW